MVEPGTYSGYDANGNAATVTAQDANGDINPSEVESAVNNLQSTLESQFKELSSALRGVEQDANDAVVVQGSKIGGAIEETCSVLESVPNSIMGRIGNLKSEAEAAHDRLQNKYNDEERLLFTLSESEDSNVTDYFLNIDKSIFGSKVSNKGYHPYINLVNDMELKDKVKLMSEYQRLTTGGHVFRTGSKKTEILNNINEIQKSDVSYFEISLGDKA